MSKHALCRLFTLIGVSMTAIGVAFWRVANLGTDPFQILLEGIDLYTPFGFGTTNLLFHGVLLIFMWFHGRKFIGLTTLFTMFFFGYIVEGSEFLLRLVVPQTNLLGQVVLLFVGILITCFGLALYYPADLGVSTYDSVALVLAERKVAQYQFCRMGADLVCLVLGIFLGASFGMGTVSAALLMGPIINFFRQNITEPWLKAKG